MPSACKRPCFSAARVSPNTSFRAEDSDVACCYCRGPRFIQSAGFEDGSLGPVSHVYAYAVDCAEHAQSTWPLAMSSRQVHGIDLHPSAYDLPPSVC